MPNSVSLAIAIITEAILVQTSTKQVPSLQRVAFRYLKLVTCSNFWPFMLIFALMLFLLLVVILFFFCADSHSICPCSIYESVGEVLKFTSAAAHRLMSSANCRLRIDLPVMEMDV